MPPSVGPAAQSPGRGTRPHFSLERAAECPAVSNQPHELCMFCASVLCRKCCCWQKTTERQRGQRRREESTPTTRTGSSRSGPKRGRPPGAQRDSYFKGKVQGHELRLKKLDELRCSLMETLLNRNGPQKWWKSQKPVRSGRVQELSLTRTAPPPGMSRDSGALLSPCVLHTLAFMKDNSEVGTHPPALPEPAHPRVGRAATLGPACLRAKVLV